jgi:DNA invertase Pin-like site-specific DNA recombinase
MVRKAKSEKDMRAVGYCRVSTVVQAKEGVSLEAQETRIREYCAFHKLALGEIVVDAGESAKTLAGRPGVQKVLALVAARQVGSVVIYKLDRMFRNTIEALETSQNFERHGVALCSISEQLDTSSAMGKFFFTLTAAYAEMERGITSERTIEGLAQVKSSGTSLGRVPYGYDAVYVDRDGVQMSKETAQRLNGVVARSVQRRFVLNEKEQKYVKWMVDSHSAGMSLMDIANALNSRGIKAKFSAAGSRWHPSTVSSVLAYAGKSDIIEEGPTDAEIL